MATDIDIGHLIFSKTPERWHPYIKLARLDRPIGTWLLLLPCWWGIVLAGGGFFMMHLHDWFLLLVFAVGALLMRSAGCIINDLWDRKLDAKVDRTQTRPLATGEISVRQALALLAGLLAVSFIVLLLLNTLCFKLGLFSLVLVVAYPLMKRVTWWPQLFLGLTFNWGALMGWSAVTGSLGFSAVVLYIGGIAWTLAYDTIYAHQDKEGDALLGIKSTALLFGEDSKKIVAICFATAMALFLIAKFSASPNILTPVLALLPIGHIVWQLRNWDMNDPDSCLKIFRSNRILGALLLPMFGV